MPGVGGGGGGGGGGAASGGASLEALAAALAAAAAAAILFGGPPTTAPTPFLSAATAPTAARTPAADAGLFVPADAGAVLGAASPLGLPASTLDAMGALLPSSHASRVARIGTPRKVSGLPSAASLASQSRVN